MTRMLHAVGVPLDELGLARDGARPPAIRRAIWRRSASTGTSFLGTPVRFWFESELTEVFGLTEQPSAANADELYDQLTETLARAGVPAARPVRTVPHRGAGDHRRPAPTTSPRTRALRRRPGLHRARRPDLPRRPVHAPRRGRLGRPARPARRRSRTSTPDATPGCSRRCAAPAGASSQAGGTATDTGVIDAGSEPLDAGRGRAHPPRPPSAGPMTRGRGRRLPPEHALPAGRDVRRGRARHAAAPRRDPQPPPPDVRARTGRTPATTSRRSARSPEPLTPILSDFGTDPTFRLVLFTVDETDVLAARSRRWPASTRPSTRARRGGSSTPRPRSCRYRRAITDSAGFTKTSGFIDDTRAFCSIPARHDMSRRVDAAFLASLVATHQLAEEDAFRLAHRLVDDIPRATFRLG